MSAAYLSNRTRGERGLFKSTVPALDRFKEKCRLDEVTGCVLWTGGTTHGRGNSARYGSFWFEGRRWFAHRWAAKYIKGLKIDGLQVDHCCPFGNTPNTLCVEHLQAIPASANRELQWLRVSVGIDQYPFPEWEPTRSDYVAPPAWLDPQGHAAALADCPF